MTRSVQQRLAQACGLSLFSLLVLLTVPACNTGKSTSGSGTTGAAATDDQSADASEDTSPNAGLSPQMTSLIERTLPKSGPLGEPFVGWEGPQVVFVLTGQAHGYLEPCGCSERQSGGLARRADLIRQIKEKYQWPVVELDVGGSLNEDRVQRLQSKIKFDVMLQALNRLGYQGLELGTEELMLGPEALYTSHLNGDAAGEFHLGMLGANLTLLSSKEIGIPLDYKIIEAGGVKVGVTGVISESIRKGLELAGAFRNEDMMKAIPAADGLPPVLTKLQGESPELLVLLSHGTPEEAAELAEKFPQFHLIVSAGGPEDPSRAPTWVGETMIVQVGKKGKNAAVVGYFPQDTSQTLKLELLELDMDRFQSDPSMREMMASYQGQLTNRYAELVEDSTVSDGDAQFVGADQCKDCHTYAYKVWSNTKHAHALDVLETGRKGQEATWVARLHDPECLCCHTTGWKAQEALRYASGFTSLNDSPHLAGNQCENCHGAGSAHIESEQTYKSTQKLTAEILKSREAMRLSKATANEQVCMKCHDNENSPTFQFDERWPKVNHSGRKD